MIKKAKIQSTMLGRGDRGIPTWVIFVKFDGCCCGIGGYALDSYDPRYKTRVFRAESMESIFKVLETVGADNWEDLPGKYIRFEDNGWGSTITKIGNIIEDKWFDLKEFFGKVGKTYDQT